MKVENLSNKPMGIGGVTILPGETKTIPEEYERNPSLKFYERNNLIKVVGEPSELPKTEEEIAKDKQEAEKKAIEEAETLRQQRLASLDGISEEDLAKLANELGINPAECKDTADVLKKVKATLKK